MPSATDHTNDDWADAFALEEEKTKMLQQLLHDGAFTRMKLKAAEAKLEELNVIVAFKDDIIQGLTGDLASKDAVIENLTKKLSQFEAEVALQRGQNSSLHQRVGTIASEILEHLNALKKIKSSTVKAKTESTMSGEVNGSVATQKNAVIRVECELPSVVATATDVGTQSDRAPQPYLTTTSALAATTPGLSTPTRAIPVKLETDIVVTTSSAQLDRTPQPYAITKSDLTKVPTQISSPSGPLPTKLVTGRDTRSAVVLIDAEAAPFKPIHVCGSTKEVTTLLREAVRADLISLDLEGAADMPILIIVYGHVKFKPMWYRSEVSKADWVDFVQNFGDDDSQTSFVTTDGERKDTSGRMKAMFGHLLQKDMYKQIYLGNGAFSDYDDMIESCASDPNLKRRVTLIGYNPPSPGDGLRIRPGWKKVFLQVNGISEGNARVVKDLFKVPHAFVLRNGQGQRVDGYLAHASAELRKTKQLQHRLCYKYILNRNCTAGNSCKYKHSNTLTHGEKEALRFLHRRMPCHAGSGCGDWSCVFGHHCSQGGRSHNMAACPFPEKLHGIDTKVVSRRYGFDRR